MPESERRELVFVLEELQKLRSEERAIPEMEGVRSRFGRHLHRLYPLVVRGLGLGGDEEVEGGLVAVVRRVGEEFEGGEEDEGEE